MRLKKTKCSWDYKMAIYKGLEAKLHETFWGDRGSDLEVNDLLRMLPQFSGKALELSLIHI